MNRSASMKLLAGVGGFVVIVGVYFLAMITMRSLDNGSWSLMAIFLMFVMTMVVIVGLATLSSVFGEYSYSKGWREGSAAVQVEKSAKADNVSN